MILVILVTLVILAMLAILVILIIFYFHITSKPKFLNLKGGR